MPRVVGCADARGSLLSTSAACVVRLVLNLLAEVLNAFADTSDACATDAEHRKRGDTEQCQLRP
jgi:hypothetical protein